jgi:hypothetical protein
VALDRDWNLILSLSNKTEKVKIKGQARNQAGKKWV